MWKWYGRLYSDHMIQKLEMDKAEGHSKGGLIKGGPREIFAVSSYTSGHLYLLYTVDTFGWDHRCCDNTSTI